MPQPDTVLVLVGDAPLLRPETLAHLVEIHRKARAAATILTTHLDYPTGYGRIVRDQNRVRAIVEEKVATPEQKRIHEINSGIICFSRTHLLKHLEELSADNAQKEFLLTDLVEIFNRHRLKVAAFPTADSREVLGANDRVELAQIEKLLRLRKAMALMREGVTVVDPQNTYIDADVEVGRDTVIEPGVSLLGRTRLGMRLPHPKLLHDHRFIARRPRHRAALLRDRELRDWLPAPPSAPSRACGRAR